MTLLFHMAQVLPHDPSRDSTPAVKKPINGHFTSPLNNTNITALFFIEINL